MHVLRRSLLASMTVVMLGVGFLVGPATASSTATPKVTNGGNLVVDVNAPWLSLDPASAKGITIPFPVYEEMFQTESNNTLAPELGLTHKWADGGLAYEITLRKGVTFQDGTPFNAQAAAFNLNRYNAAGTDCDGYVNGVISSVTVTGPYSLTVNLTRRDAAIPAILSNIYCGPMVSPTAVATYGANYQFHPIGTGPFEYSNGVPGNTAVLSRFGGYWGPKAHLASVTIQASAVEASTWSNLTSGQANVWYQADGILYGAQAKSAGYTILRDSAATQNYFQISTQNGPFTNPLARKAVIEAINVKSIIKNVLSNAVTYDIGPIVPSMLGYVPPQNVKGAVSYNPSGAKALVSQLGGLSFTLGYSTGNQVLVSIVTAEQQMLEAAGMTVTLQPLSSTTFLQEELGDHYDTLQTVGGSPNADPDLFFATRFDSAAPDNEFGLKDPEVDSLIQQGETTLSQAARAKIYEKLNAYVASTVLCQDEIGTNPYYYFSDKTVHNFTPDQYGWFNWNQVWMA
jgi:peptide/nickel transport system substrate-binding protein